MNVGAVLKKRINVTGAVLTDGNKVLAAQRGPDKALPGFWEFPGGKIESGETPEESLARELEEELLCQASIGEYITTTEYEYDFGTVVLSTYFCTLIKGEPQLTEHTEIRWVPASELDTLEWAPADIPAVQIIMKNLS